MGDFQERAVQILAWLMARSNVEISPALGHAMVAAVGELVKAHEEFDTASVEIATYAISSEQRMRRHRGAVWN